MNEGIRSQCQVCKRWFPTRFLLSKHSRLVHKQTKEERYAIRRESGIKSHQTRRRRVLGEIP